MGKRLVVCGGRRYQDALFVRQTLRSLRPLFIATCEYPTGVDQLAKLYAMENGINYAGFPKPWKEGAYARVPRARVMLELVRPDLVVAFPGGPGTDQTVKLAMELGIEVNRFFRREPEGIHT